MKNNDFRLDIPDDCDHTVTDRITEICPVFDEKEKEKIFAMSERKYNKKKNTSAGNDCEDKVRGVEIYRRPKWYRPLAAVAAFVLVFGGVAGGIALIKKAEIPDSDIYSQVETIPQTEAVTEEQTNPTAENSFAMLTKEDIYNKMLNSVDYYSKASGKFIVYTESNMTGSAIEFETDIENSKAYCRESEINISNPDDMASGFDIIEGEFPSGYVPSDRIVYCDGEKIHDINESSKSIYPTTEKAVTLEESRNNTEKIMSLYVDAIFSNRRDATNTVYAEPYLFPQVMAVRHLPDFSKWEIVRTETYAGRECTVIRNNNAGEVYPDGNITMYIDNETGVLLYYRIEDKASNLQGCLITEYIAFDEEATDVRTIDLSEYSPAADFYDMTTKEGIYNKMLNSIDFYDKVSGKIIISENPIEICSVVEFESNLDTSRAYCRDTETKIINIDDVVNGSPIQQGEFEEGYIPFDYTNYSDGEKMYYLNEAAKSYSIGKVSNRNGNIVTDEAIRREDAEIDPEKERYYFDEKGLPVYVYRANPTNAGFAAMCLQPQEMTFSFLTDFENWEIVGNETYAGRECVVLKGINDVSKALEFTLYVDIETGTLLKYTEYDIYGSLKDFMITEYIAFDEEAADVREVNFDDYEQIKESAIRTDCY